MTALFPVSEHVTLTRFYRMWRALHEHIGEVDRRLRRRITNLESDSRGRLVALERKAFRMALTFDHIHQALGTLEQTTSTLLSTLHDVQGQNTDLNAKVDDLLSRVAAGSTTPADAQAEWADAQAEIDTMGGQIDALDQHLRDALDGAKATLPAQSAAAVTPDGNGGIPDAPVQPAAPAGSVTNSDVTEEATPTPGNSVTGLGGVSVDGQAADAAPTDGTVTIASSPLPPVAADQLSPAQPVAVDTTAAAPDVTTTPDTTTTATSGDDSSSSTSTSSDTAAS